ncbi:MAG: penicillin-binding transpeptidase domain-containing protein [Eubacteriaceae bacterium]|nr:penicillin-binding transpeptidase domain-containing protein [Eubacteriaceae bacterium]
MKKRTHKKTFGEIRINRMLVIMGLFTAALLVIFGKLVYLQVIDSTDQYARQVDQLVDEVNVKASRGNIYDRNMNVLAQDSSAKAVHIIPKDVEKPDELAQVLSDQLQVDKTSILNKINQLEDDKVEMKTNVSKDTADQLMKKITKGLAYENGTLYAIPAEVADAKAAAEAVSGSFENLSYDDAYGYLTQKENNALLIKGQVDNSLAQSILDSQTTKDANGKTTSTNGVELIEDNRRYYTNGNFASYVLGFTNNDYKGVCGVESTYDEWLSGEDGVVYIQKDANGTTIPSQTKTVKQPKQGNDLVLTLDSNIQTLTEKALSSAIEQWKAKSGTAIVMDTKTGEIVAMATKPDYDLNDPYTISSDYQSKHSSDLSGQSETDQLNTMWSNPAVSFVYEPGSTFKTITASAALEEGVVTPDTHVSCSGSMNVNGVTVRCTATHGDETVAQAIEHSCNPGLIQIIQKLDPNIFYRYAYDYGFGQKTGIELTGEESGIMTRVFEDNSEINLLDYSTLSFGQGMATTPIQLLSALNCVVNNGYYVEPTVISSKNKNITSNGSKGTTKQIISNETSAELRNIMEKVVSGNSSLAQVADGYSIGGKTGTAEKFIDGSYSASNYVTSFYGYAPVDDPQYSVIVVVDEADSSAYGSQSAAPTGIQILKDTLDYMGQGKQSDTELQKNAVTVPDLTGQELDFAKQILDEKGIKYRVNNPNDGTVIVSQSLEAKSQYDGSTEMVLEVGSTTQDQSKKVKVPDLSGMNVQEANELLKGLGLNIKINGSGFATGQDPAAGTEVDKNSEVTVTFSQ